MNRGAKWLQCCVTSRRACYVTLAPRVYKAEVAGAAKWAHRSADAYVREVIGTRALTSGESTMRFPPDLRDRHKRHRALHARFFLSLFDINTYLWYKYIKIVIFNCAHTPARQAGSLKISTSHVCLDPWSLFRLLLIFPYFCKFQSHSLKLVVHICLPLYCNTDG